MTSSRHTFTMWPLGWEIDTLANVLEVSFPFETAARLRAEGLRARVPLLVREVRHARRVEKRNYSLYGRYIFCWVPPGGLRKVLDVQGVRGVLRRAGSLELGEIDDAVVEGIIGRVESKEFKLGDTVVVDEGRWVGWQGLFSRREEDRIFVMLSMLGRKVELPFHISEIHARCGDDRL